MNTKWGHRHVGGGEWLGFISFNLTLYQYDWIDCSIKLVPLSHDTFRFAGNSV